MKCNRFTRIACLSGVILMTSCGGSDHSAEQTSTSAAIATAAETVSATSPSTTRVTMGGTSAPEARPSQAEAAQFLGQASFGASDGTIVQVVNLGKAGWIEAQFTTPQTRHRDYLLKNRAGLPEGTLATPNQFFESFWTQVAKGDDQLRQRVTYALSQIFVVSFVDGNLYTRPVCVADYYDTLGRYAFGNFRDLLQVVALHPAMGIYLSHLRNQKENGPRVPDENFAREVMQLMSIGLYQLNQDGSVKTSNGAPIETYTHDDVAGLAKVFTGWSWSGPDRSDIRFYGGFADPARDWTQMQMYPAFHSTSNKSFLGVNTNGSGEADLKVALDTLFKHPNVGPFIGRQLIQRLVTSNPSPAYVARVAAAFANNGSGVRGDMRAVLRAILLDREAGDTGHPKKLREPVVRLANWMRAFKAQSSSGRFMVPNVEDPVGALGQAPLRSPSVFNFYRPSYTPPNTSLSAAGMVAPEMQITGEPSTIGYINFIRSAIAYGTGQQADIHAPYTNELPLAAKPAQLLDRLQLLLMGGSMSTTLRNQIISALNAVPIPNATGSNSAMVELARKNRVYLAVFLIMVSPEYIAQH